MAGGVDAGQGSRARFAVVKTEARLGRSVLTRVRLEPAGVKLARGWLHWLPEGELAPDGWRGCDPGCRLSRRVAVQARIPWLADDGHGHGPFLYLYYATYTLRYASLPAVIYIAC